MSHVTQPRVSLPIQVRSHRTGGVGALLIAATAAVALVLALSGGPSNSAFPTGRAHRPGIAAAIAARTAVPPDESGIAAAIAPRTAAGPDESSVAASIGGVSSRTAGGPDESRTAASIGG